MTSSLIRVAVVDDHAVVREGIRRVLESEPGVTIVGEGKNGAEALALLDRQHPDVLVIDVAMPGQTGLDIADQVRRSGAATRVLILSMYDQPEYVRQSVRAGARGYLLKDSPPAELRRAVRTVHRGETWFPTLRSSQPDSAVEPAPPPIRSAFAVLTPRERDVLFGIANGETNKAIATRLGISHRTVETHRESLMNKLGVRTVAGLTRLVLEAGS